MWLASRRMPPAHSCMMGRSVSNMAGRMGPGSVMSTCMWEAGTKLVNLHAAYCDCQQRSVLSKTSSPLGGVSSSWACAGVGPHTSRNCASSWLTYTSSSSHSSLE
jgi:hypothetical protein